MNQKEIWNALIESFKKTPPENWSYEQCAAARLKDMGLVSRFGMDDLQRALGLQYEEAYKLYYGANNIDQGPHLAPGRHLIKVLEVGRDTGVISWPEA